MMKYIIGTIIFLAIVLGASYVANVNAEASIDLIAGDISIRSLPQFRASTTPHTAITTRTHAKDVYLPFSSTTLKSLTVTDLQGSGTKCLEVDTDGALQTASAACGSGDPNVIIVGGFLRASTTGEWLFPSGFVAGASSTVNSNLNVQGPLSASSTLIVAGATTLSDTLDVTGLSTLGGFISTASSTINSNLTITGIATTTDVIPLTDSTSDLGSPSSFWANTYVDKLKLRPTGTASGQTAQADSVIVIDSDANGNNIEFLGETNQQATGIIWSDTGATRGFIRYNHIDDGMFLGIAGNSVIELASNFVEVAKSIRPNQDSGLDFGNSTRFWDETFTDELVLTNAGTAATAANTVRLGGQDLSAGDAGLLITTENDTEHFFASRVGIASTTPWGAFSVEQGSDETVFVVADQGTSTPHLLINGAGNVVIGLIKNIVAKLQVAGDVWFHNKVDIGVPGTAGGLDVGEGGSYTTDKDGTTVVQTFKYDDSAASGSRFTEVETTDTVTWNAAVRDRFYVCSQFKFWAARFNITQAKSSEKLTMSYYDGTSTTSMTYMGLLKDAATSTGEVILEQIAEKEYVTWDDGINSLWATADDVADTIPDLDAASFCVYFEVPTGGLATPLIHDEVKVRGDDVDIISGTPFMVLWGRARVENHDRISLSIVKAPGGTATADVDIDQNHKQTVFDFDTAGDDVTFLWTLPEGIDTSSGIELTLDYSADAADTFDLDLYAKKLQEGTAIGTGVGSDFTASTTIITAAGSVFHVDQTLTPTFISIQDMSPNEVISFALERSDGTNSLFPFSIVVHYISFAVGEHVD